jgi:hypothetical protein
MKAEKSVQLVQALVGREKIIEENLLNGLA